LPEGFVELREARAIGWLRSDLAELGLLPMWAATTPLPGAKGRGGVGTLELKPGLIAVVRPFHRGGAFGRLLGDRYGGSGRARAELAVLAQLQREGVPVVAPLAAVAQKHRAFWRLRLLTQVETGALTLPAFCAAYPQHRRWAIEAAAVTVRLAFAAGLRHPDLHPDNILVAAHGDKVRAVLIDLDRARVKRPVDAAEQDRMLVRMARYLHRHSARLPVMLTRADHLRFLRAFGLDRAGREAWWERLGAKLRRALAQHRLVWKKAKKA
jgi:hypothetical protein